MPTLTVARGRKYGSIKADFEAVWDISDPRNIAHDGQGLYSYTGSGERNEEDIGTVRTLKPLDPLRGGITSFEITVVNTGEECVWGGGVREGGRREREGRRKGGRRVRERERRWKECMYQY